MENEFINQALDYFRIDKKKYIVVNVSRNYSTLYKEFKEIKDSDCDILEINVRALSFFTRPKKQKLKIKVNIENNSIARPDIKQPRRFCIPDGGANPWVEIEDEDIDL